MARISRCNPYQVAREAATLELRCVSCLDLLENRRRNIVCPGFADEFSSDSSGLRRKRNSSTVAIAPA